MKKSNYNILVKRNNGILIFNSFTNNYIALSTKVYNDLEEMTIQDFSNLHPNVYSVLVDKGFIIHEDKDELTLIRYKNKIATFSSRVLKIVIYPTQDCNLKCWYCYENHVAHTKMDDSVKNKIILFVRKELEKNAFDDIFVTFFGGEPLMYFDEIAYPVCTRVKDMVEAKKKGFSCFFVTNGSLINEKMLPKLKVIKPRFQITIDGDKAKHDKVRIWKRGNQPTFDHIIWAVHKLTSEIITDDFFLTLRINYDNQTLLGTQEILEKIKDINPRKLFIHFERVWQTEGGEEQTEVLKRTMLSFIKAGFFVDQGAFHGHPYSCPSDMVNSIIINYDGTIHKCNGRTLTNGTRYGEILDDGSLKVDENMMAKRYSVATFEHKECLSCKMLPMCMGPCSQKLLEHGGKWAKEICTMNSIDTSLQDYLLLDFIVKSKL